MSTLKDFRQIRQIGKGGNGFVHLYEEIATGRQYAAKVIVGACGKTAKSQIEAEKMMTKIRKIDSPYLVKYYKSFHPENDPSSVILIMEYCPGGDLSGFICGRKEPLELSLLMKLIAQLIVGLFILHHHKPKNIIHRDIKPQNIFVVDDNLKIGDFGTTKLLESTLASAHTMFYTKGYAAPEVFKGEYGGVKVDIYSLALVFYQLISLAPYVPPLFLYPSTTGPSSPSPSIFVPAAHSAAPSSPCASSLSLGSSSVVSLPSLSDSGLAVAGPVTPPVNIEGNVGGGGIGAGAGADKKFTTLRELVDAVPRTDVPELKELIVEMGSTDPEKRPLLRDILQLKFIKAAICDLDWDSLPDEICTLYGIDPDDDPKKALAAEAGGRPGAPGAGEEHSQTYFPSVSSLMSFSSAEGQSIIYRPLLDSSSSSAPPPPKSSSLSEETSGDRGGSGTAGTGEEHSQTGFPSVSSLMYFSSGEGQSTIYKPLLDSSSSSAPRSSSLSEETSGTQ